MFFIFPFVFENAHLSYMSKMPFLRLRNEDYEKSTLQQSPPTLSTVKHLLALYSTELATVTSLTLKSIQELCQKIVGFGEYLRARGVPLNHTASY